MELVRILPAGSIFCSERWNNWSMSFFPWMLCVLLCTSGLLSIRCVLDCSRLAPNNRDKLLLLGILLGEETLTSSRPSEWSRGYLSCSWRYSCSWCRSSSSWWQHSESGEWISSSPTDSMSYWWTPSKMESVLSSSASLSHCNSSESGAAVEDFEESPFCRDSSMMISSADLAVTQRIEST